MRSPIDPRVRSTTAAAAVLFATIVLATVSRAETPSSAFAPSTATDEFVHHALKVTLDPKSHHLTAEDTVSVPARLFARRDGTIHFLLHAGLNPSSATEGVSLERIERAPKEADFGLREGGLDIPRSVTLDLYRATIPEGRSSFVLRYAGEILHALEEQPEESARGFSETPGTIAADGVYLSQSTYWYPWFGDGQVSFVLETRLPPGWDAVSQGKRTVHEIGSGTTGGGATGGGASRVCWESPEPQEEIYLIAGRFTEYTRTAGAVTAMAFLRTPDANLAGKYLEATGQYLEMYGKLLGPYPYAKFALVENFWETGYGMPSFTLLGPAVIRLPFILHSSYPHEILHNWWGNGVFVDSGKGNWCEGLTAYLADHLEQEQQGKGAEYRQTTLQKYADYVSHGKDFPLTVFRERHSPATEAVGYGKAMMLFHMIRWETGAKDREAIFTEGLQRFFKKNLFKAASWDDLADAFQAAGTFPAKEFVRQWTVRAGAPRFRLTNLRAERSPGSGRDWALRGTVEQIQPGEKWMLWVPLVVTTEGRGEAWVYPILEDEKSTRSGEIALNFPSRPLRVDLDPEFDVFRQVEREETPPALSQMFGAEKALALLPASEPSPMREAYRAVAESWGRGKEGSVEVRLDSEIDTIPHDRSVWLFGWENRFRDTVGRGIGTYGASLDDTGLRLEKDSLPRTNHSAVVVIRQPENPDHAIAWVGAGAPQAIPGLGRKLPHYGKYSYLGFEGDEPTNVVKGRWPTVDSPLTVYLGPDGKPLPASAPDSAASTGAAEPSLRPAMGKLPVRRPLATLPPALSPGAMMDTVRFLASPELEGRGFGSAGLERAAEFIANAFREAGLKPGGDTEGSYFQTWKAAGGNPPREAEQKNVIGILPGRKADWSGQSLVICAHYDHLGRGWPDVKSGNAGKTHPGADDNASGVAVLLELARALGKDWSPDRTVIFAAFAGEEAGRLGSEHFVESASPREGGNALRRRTEGTLRQPSDSVSPQQAESAADPDADDPAHRQEGVLRQPSGSAALPANGSAAGPEAASRAHRQEASVASPGGSVAIPEADIRARGHVGSVASSEGSLASSEAKAASAYPLDRCVGAITLDTVGRLGGGKLLVLGTGSAREWIHIFNGAGFVTGIPVQGVADDFGSSDQKSFLDAGVPAVQLFTGPNADYHAPGDTPDKIDASGLVKVALIAREAIEYLAGREEPMTVTLHSIAGAGVGPLGATSEPGSASKANTDAATGSRTPAAGADPGPSSTNRPTARPGPGSATPAAGDVPVARATGGPREPAQPSGSRKVSLGTVPDFECTGPGVRLSGVTPGSPAEKAGLAAGDILIHLGATAVNDLRGFSDALKALHPGEKVKVTFTRNGVERTVEAEVVAR